MKVFVAVKFKPFGIEEFVGVTKSHKKAMELLKKEFPYMREKNGDLISDSSATYLLNINEYEMEE